MRNSLTEQTHTKKKKSMFVDVLLSVFTAFPAGPFLYFRPANKYKFVGQPEPVQGESRTKKPLLLPFFASPEPLLWSSVCLQCFALDCLLSQQMLQDFVAFLWAHLTRPCGDVAQTEPAASRAIEDT